LLASRTLCAVGSQKPSAAKPAQHELPQWMRSMLDAGRSDEMIAAVTALVDEMAESHARVLLSLKQSLKRICSPYPVSA